MTEHNLIQEPSADLGEISPVGWKPATDMTFEDWEYAMSGFIVAQRSLNWIIGDGLNFGEQVYGEKYAQVMEATGWTYQRIADAKWVAGSVPHEVRREALSWTHHRSVAKLPPLAQEKWLKEAEENTLTASEMRTMMNGGKLEGKDILIAPPEPRTARRLLTEAAYIVASEADPWQWYDHITPKEKDQLGDAVRLAEQMIALLRGQWKSVES